MTGVIHFSMHQVSCCVASFTIKFVCHLFLLNVNLFKLITIIHCQGKAGCLSGLVFVLTGVLESLDRSDVSQLVEQYGGRVVTGVSGKTTHLLVGEDAGASKTVKVRNNGAAYTQ